MITVITHDSRVPEINYDSFELVVQTPNGIIREEAFDAAQTAILRRQFEFLEKVIEASDPTYKFYTQNCFSYSKLKDPKSKEMIEYVVRLTGFVSLNQSHTDTSLL